MMKVYHLYILCILFSFTSCFNKQPKMLFVDNRIDEHRNKYISNHPNYTSILIMSSTRLLLHNGNNDISGVLIGPMYDGFIDSHDDLHVRYLTTYLGKQIYIDSAALTITNLKVQKCKEIAYCERDSFLLLDYGYFKHYEKDVFINFIKRAIVLNILVKNGNITNIEAFNADSIYLPVFIDEEESDE